MTNINNQSQSLDKIAGLEDLNNENAAVCSGGRLDLFDGPNLTGASVSLTTSVPDLRRLGFNDRASSYRVTNAERWHLFTDFNYGGTAFPVFGTGHFSSLGPLNNAVSSVIRLA